MGEFPNAENNLFETGFVARSKEEEKKSAPGSRVYITLESNEITEQVLMGVKDETADIERSKKQIIKLPKFNLKTNHKLNTTKNLLNIRKNGPQFPISRKKYKPLDLVILIV